MENLHQLEIIILLLAVVLALTTLARLIFLPYPILLVIGGLVLAVVPGVPTVTLNPDLVFLVFLPPILAAAAYFTSLREFRANIRPISLLAVGLVLATTAAGLWQFWVQFFWRNVTPPFQRRINSVFSQRLIHR